ncbi:MAG: hypothetical protein A4E32_01453 [Methanomassiliicoccales archaeon PtaU1.Bin124]|nr:MAG: hypothetical protein A4E32_01453 [Methanomassiliicoccales archaeon PtaU1.Bin124]
MASFNCPKCGAAVEFEVKDKFVRCRYCSSDIYIDRTGAGFYYILPFAMDENTAIGTFRRWAGGSTKAKDLDKFAQITGTKRQYFPVYLFKRDVNGVDQVFVEPAASTTLPGLHSLKVPGGDMRIFDQTFSVGSAEMVKPDIEMLPYLNQMPGTAKEQALVYFPIYLMEYSFGGKSWSAVISATSGEVFTAEYPTRSSTIYQTVAVGGFLAFLAEGLIATQSLAIGLALMGLTVVGLFAGSYMVAKRM